MKKQQKSRRFYPEDLKRDAVELVDKQGYTQAEAARSLGIRPNLIGRWRREFQDHKQGDDVPKDDMDELKKLRRENRQLREEAEILKNVWSAPITQVEIQHGIKSIASMYPAC